MFTSYNVIIATVFRLGNFGLIIFLTIYGFKKYLLPTISAQITKKETEKENLLHQHTLFEARSSELIELMKQDVVYCDQLKKKLVLWQKSVLLHQDNLEQERVNRESALTKKYQQRQEWQHNAALQSEMTRVVVAELEKSLSAYFSDDEKNSEYMKKIIDSIRER